MNLIQDFHAVADTALARITLTWDLIQAPAVDSGGKLVTDSAGNQLTVRPPVSAYRIRRATDAAFTQNVAVINHNSTVREYLDNSLDPSKRYYYQIVVKNPDGSYQDWADGASLVAGFIPTAAFTLSPATAPKGATIAFENDSIGGASYAWFIDNLPFSSAQNPLLNTHDLDPGGHPVKLVVTNETDSAQTIHSFTITVPHVAITSPANNAQISGNQTLAATITNGTSAQFSVDGTSVEIDPTAPFSTVINTLLLLNGGHELAVAARDDLGNVATDSITVSVSNLITPIGAVFVYNELRLPFYHGRPKKDWGAVTEIHPYEDAGASFNELSDIPPITWDLIYNGVKPDLADAFQIHYDTYRLSRPFTFVDKWGNSNTNVRYKSWDIDHDGNNSDANTVKMTLIKYP